MTEADWLACRHPERMFDFLRGKRGDPDLMRVLSWWGLQLRRSGTTPPPAAQTSGRKLRLYACACCRRIWPLLHNEHSRRAVEVSESFADEQATEEELVAARDAAWRVLQQLPSEPIQLPFAVALAHQLEPLRPHASATQAAVIAADRNVEAIDQAVMRVGLELTAINGKEQEAAAMIGAAVRETLLRDIFGNPFRLVTIDSAWLRWNDGCVVRIAQAISEDGRFEDLPILADALLDAGCESEDILNHCREPALHVRGCWVLDLLLAKK